MSSSSSGCHDSCALFLATCYLPYAGEDQMTELGIPRLPYLSIAIWTAGTQLAGFSAEKVPVYVDHYAPKRRQALS